MLKFAASLGFASRALGRAALLALGLAGLSPAPAAANAEVVQEISAYLNSIETITGEFRQISPGDVITDGEYALRRPGRMYFRYEPPSPVRVVADGFWVAVFDEEEDPTIDRYPLSETPLYLLLKEDVDLTDAVRSIEETDKYYRVVIFDPSGDTDGEILLVFDKSPLRLREWTVYDGEGYATKVVLKTSQFNVKVDNALFVIETEEEDKIGD